MFIDWFTVGLVETPKWVRAYPLDSYSLEIWLFYDETSEFQKGEFWNLFWNDFIL